MGSKGVSTLSLTSAIDGVGCQSYAPAALPPGNDPVPIVQQAGCERKTSPPPEFDPRTVQPLVSRYTDQLSRPTHFSLKGEKYTRCSQHCLHSDRQERFNIIFCTGLTHSAVYISELLIRFSNSPLPCPREKRHCVSLAIRHFFLTVNCPILHLTVQS